MLNIILLVRIINEFIVNNDLSYSRELTRNRLKLFYKKDLTYKALARYNIEQWKEVNR